MPTVSLQAYGFAETFKLKELLGCFASAAEARMDKDRIMATFGPQRLALVYDFGAVVFVGAEPAERQRVLDALAAKLKPDPQRPIEESFLVETGSPQIEVRFDRVMVPELTLPVVEIVAGILAQSVAMDYYASDVAEIEAATARITQALTAKGRVPRNTRQLIRFIGQCIATRNEIVSTLALFDKPDSTWESEQLDRLWSGLHQMLELDDRYRLLEAKLRLFQENMEVLVDLTRTGQTLRLELIVAVLIVMEVVVMIWQMASQRH